MSPITNADDGAARPNTCQTASIICAAKLLATILVSGAALQPGPAVVERSSRRRDPRPESKLGRMLDQLILSDGATISQLGCSTGWPPHILHAALSRLRQRGYAVVRDLCRGHPLYRISITGAFAAPEETAS